ncbi:hypothetical protein ACFLWO_01160 [Chloroflexota bacterium]
MSDSRRNPYLSIVITSRNDDHGGNLLRRMQVSLSGLLEQLEKYHIESELILVDWNPPDNKPLVKDVIKWPDRLRYCTIRVIIVPPSIHQRYEYADIIPLHTVVAVNCGIRRARGQFVLPGVIDLLYSDELMSHIAAKGLREDERYRVDRCDVDRNAVQYDILKDQLDYCQSNIIKINAHVLQKHRRIQRSLPDLHTNACGDFQLMSRHYWHLLRGYREADIAPSYVDGLLSYASYAAGVREVILNDTMRIYHIDHDDKFNERIKETRPPFEDRLSFPFLPAWLNNKIVALYRRFLRLMGYKIKTSVYGIPTLSDTEYRKMCQDIVAGRHPYIFSDENWGLGQESLEEFVISTADWDKKYEKN